MSDFNIWMEMYRGMGAAAVVIGFLLMLGFTLLVIGVIGYVVMAIVGADDEEEGEESGAAEEYTGVRAPDVLWEHKDSLPGHHPRD